MSALDTAKRLVFEAALKVGNVSIALDARHPGVVLPADFEEAERVVLNYGLDMPIPVNDTLVGEDGVKATLSFNRRPFTTFIPWSAIFVVRSPDATHAIVTPEPKLVGFSVAVEAKNEEAAPEKPRPRLSLVPMPESE